MMFQECKVIFLLTFVIFKKSFAQPAPTNVVTTTLGNVRGTLKQTVVGNSNFYAYLGIPYAKPPIGNLRFKAPVPIDPWTGTFIATSDLPKCIQGTPILSNFEGTAGVEDCLYLNIYTPVLSNSGPIPVIIWIYGGGFITGYGAYNYYRPDFFLDQGVIFVSVNYRLGVFGFLSLEDSVLPGNSALKDQVLAITWIKNNIANFGGDVNKITVFGESAGAASVAYLMQSPLTQGLFQRTIMDSGNSLMPWSLTRNAAYHTQILAGYLGIYSSDSTILLKGLQNVDAEVLLQVSNSPNYLLAIQVNFRNGLPFGPVIEPDIENAFFTKQTFESLTRGEIQKIPCISGYNSLEGIPFAPLATLLYKPQFVLNISSFVPDDAHVYKIQASEAGYKIQKFYYSGPVLNLFNSNSYELVKLVSDDLFTRAQVKFVELVSNVAEVYFYRFAYQGALGGVTDRKYDGVGHAEELGYFYYNISGIATGNATDTLTRNRLVKLWSNFAKTGNPTPINDPLFQNMKWPTARSNGAGLSYFNIDINLSVGVNPDKKYTDFWNAFYIQYGHRPFDTY